MVFGDLQFKPRREMPGLRQARLMGCSVITGSFIRGYEIMDSQGDVRDGLTKEDVEDFFNGITGDST